MWGIGFLVLRTLRASAIVNQLRNRRVRCVWFENQVRYWLQIELETCVIWMSFLSDIYFGFLQMIAKRVAQNDFESVNKRGFRCFNLTAYTSYLVECWALKLVKLWHSLSIRVKVKYTQSDLFPLHSFYLGDCCVQFKKLMKKLLVLVGGRTQDSRVYVYNFDN